MCSGPQWDDQPSREALPEPPDSEGLVYSPEMDTRRSELCAVHGPSHPGRDQILLWIVLVQIQWTHASFTPGE